MILKLASVIEALQEEVMTQNLQIQELVDENAKLRAFSQIAIDGKGSGVNQAIDGILMNPTIRSALFEKLAKQTFSSNQ